MVRKINKAFDRIPEPYRFFTVLVVVIPGIILKVSDDRLTSTLGLIYLLILLFIRIYPVVIKE